MRKLRVWWIYQKHKLYMKSFQDHRVIIIPITEEDFRNATVYGDGFGCPLYQSVLRIFHPEYIRVSDRKVYIESKEFNIKGSDNTDAYAGIDPMDVDFLIRVAKKYVKLKPIIVHLIPVKHEIST